MVNDEHHLLMVGGSDGVVECWDHRMRDRVATLDTLKNKNFESVVILIYVIILFNFFFTQTAFCSKR